MRLLFVLSSRLVRSRYLAHGIHPRLGERYLGVVWREGDRDWRNDRDRCEYTTRQAAGAALLT